MTNSVAGAFGNIAQLFDQHQRDPGKILYRQYADGAWRDVGVAELGVLVARWQQLYGV